MVNLLEKSILSISPATEENSTDSTESDHIRTLSMESSNMDPEVVEMLETTEMSHLSVQDAMVPRNQVQVLDDHDSLENMEIARTAATLACLSALEIWIIAWASFPSNMHSDSSETTIDLQSLAKPAMLSKDATLPVALRKMMKWKVHMALVRDEFGGIDSHYLRHPRGSGGKFRMNSMRMNMPSKRSRKANGIWPNAGSRVARRAQLDENGNEDELTGFGGSSPANLAEFRKKEKP